MRESVGQAFLYNLVIILITIMIFILVGSLAYSKAYKIKNKLVDIVEKYKGYNSSAKDEIDEYLGSIGYKVNPHGSQRCKQRGDGIILTNEATTYRYCVYRYEESKGTYYGINTYIYFEFPIIGDVLEVPVYGETEVFYNETKIEG